MKGAIWVCALGAAGRVRVHNASTGHVDDLRSVDVLRVEPDPLAPNDGSAHGVVTLSGMVLRRSRLWYVPR